MAEAIASMLMINVVAPGHPVIVGPWPFVSDLRTGSFTGGSGEEAIISAAAAQMTNYYGLVSSVGAGMSDSKVPDNQAGSLGCRGSRGMPRWAGSRSHLP